MEAYRIVEKVLKKHPGLAKKLSDFSEKSAELYRSHGRRPKTEDYQHGTGNVSPVKHYIDFVKLYSGQNVEAGRHLHRLVTRELRGIWADRRPGKPRPLRDLLNGILTQATQMITGMNGQVKDASDAELVELDERLADIEAAVPDARRRVRDEIREREAARSTSRLGRQP